jgi:hypothetical protein
MTGAALSRPRRAGGGANLASSTRQATRYPTIPFVGVHRPVQSRRCNAAELAVAPDHAAAGRTPVSFLTAGPVRLLADANGGPAVPIPANYYPSGVTGARASWAPGDQAHIAAALRSGSGEVMIMALMGVARKTETPNCAATSRGIR